MATAPVPVKKNQPAIASQDAPPPPVEREIGVAESGPAASTRVDPAFPIVGIGASAGGLEALDQFLKNVPDGSGMAFVVVQHLDPTHKGMLVELLQRCTAMPVVQARDGVKVEPDHVYVIPPNKDMSLLHGTLHLLPPASPRGLNLPIDFFFRSLAEDQQESGIGVILSGMGSDGTLGLRAIKEKAGAAFVQTVASAKFDGMPCRVIEAGLADVVAPVEDLPRRIMAYRKHALHMTRREAPEDRAPSALDKVFILLRSRTGNDFSLYKKSTVYRRIERRMGLHQIESVADYVRYIRENRDEIELLFEELLIGVTSFFRDPAAWEHLKAEIIPPLLAIRSTGGVLRAWVPGCSTGEEAYSLAIVFKEALEPLKPAKNIALQVFATDLHRDAIEKARLGLYPENIAADVSPERLHRFFVHEERGYRVGKEVREMVVFAPQNIIMDPPFTKLDVLSCRNLLIYLSGEMQKKLIPLFHYSLNPGGILFLGSAETVGSFSHLFSPCDGKTRLYRRLDQPMGVAPIDFPPAFLGSIGTFPGEPDPESARPKPAPANLQALADRMLVQHFSPAGVLCNDKGDILYISSGRTGKYLEPAVGKANLNLFAMTREGLRHELSRAFSRALREDRTITVRGVKVAGNGGLQTVDLTVQKLAEPKELRGTMLVVLADMPTAEPAAKPSRTRRAHHSPPAVGRLEQELQRNREEVQTIREEMQTSQEELRSTNEELQSTNEELQSTNEELTTSKEEMQSLNEELQTVNHELQAKVDELSRSANDMKNLLNSTDIATLFLDGELKVRRFTTPTTKIIKLIPGDAGRPITDIVSELDYAELADDAREVLRTLIFKEKQVSTRDGRSFAVRIMPYRTLENVIDGVVITFADASALRTLETALSEQAHRMRQLADSLPDLVWGCRADGFCDHLGRQWVEYTGIPEMEQLGYGWLEQVHPDDRERIREGWRMAVKAGVSFEGEMRLRGRSGGYGWFRVRSVPLRDSRGTIVRWYGINTDVDDLKRSEEQRRSNPDRFASMLEDISDIFLVVDHDLRVVSFNRAAERMFGRLREDVIGRTLRDALPGLPGSAADELERALADRKPVSFEMRSDPGSHRSLYVVRAYPQLEPGGLFLFLERIEERDPGEGPDTAEG